jgi:hypothetical protein
MDKKKLNEYLLLVGHTVIGIRCPTADYAESFSAYFGVPSAEREPDMAIDLDFLFQEGDLEIPESLFTGKTVRGGALEISGGIVTGEIGAGGALVRLHVNKGLTHGPATRVFEQLLYQAYYTCRGIRNLDSLLIHCSGVVYRGEGFLFAGPSGSGKSTIAELSAGHTVLNDEICLLDFNNGGITLHGTPFNGYYKNKKSGSARLRAVFLISHGAAHAISGAARSEAVPKLAKEIVPPVALHEAMDRLVFIRMLDMADRIYSMVPVYRLEFLPDRSFWKEIDGLIASGAAETENKTGE